MSADDLTGDDMYMPELENRYAIFKLSDVSEALTEDEMLEMVILSAKVEAYREKRGAAPLEGVVVENDWPDYETVKRMILDREAEERKL